MLLETSANTERALHDEGEAARVAPADAGRRASSRRAADRVDASGADSFPASDPPSWWSGA